MKICPKCNKTYSDETLNFCLDDGTVLNQTPETSSLSESPPPTVMMGQPQQTTPNQPFGNQPTEPTWDKAPQYQTPNAGASSKTWLWAVGIIFLVVFLCGGGFIGIALLVPDEGEDFVPGNDNSDTSVNSTKNSTKNGKVLHSTNFSTWDIEINEYLQSKYRNGELILTSKDGYYYVILTKGFNTYDKTAILNVKNPEGEAASLGYGLVIHSHPQDVLSKDYAFLIRSDTKQYRIVRHTSKQESNIVSWTRSSAIKGGSQTNEIEVRVNKSKMSLYINGEFIKDVRDYTGYKDGVAGIYTSDDVPIAFLNLEIRE